MKQIAFLPIPGSREKFSVVRALLIPLVNPTFGISCYSHPYTAVLFHIYVILHTYTKMSCLCTHLQLPLRVYTLKKKLLLKATQNIKVFLSSSSSDEFPGVQKNFNCNLNKYKPHGVTTSDICFSVVARSLIVLFCFLLQQCENALDICVNFKCMCGPHGVQVLC